jgi:hypothetical protein
LAELPLVELQRAVQNLLLQPQRMPGDGIDETIVHAIAETTLVPRATRLAIYANAYRARFVDALAADYSALKTYLGDDEFERLINAYIEAHPSRYFSMRYVGQYLGDFLHATPPYSDHLDLYELAQFEWALCNAFDAADMPVLSIDDLRRIEPATWPVLQLQFHTSLQCLMLLGNAPALWTALNAEQEPPTFTVAADARAWLVWRHELRLLFRPLAEHEPLVLDAFCAGADFADVCERLSKSIPAERVPRLVAGLIQQWLQEGLVVGATSHVEFR